MDRYHVYTGSLGSSFRRLMGSNDLAEAEIVAGKHAHESHCMTVVLDLASAAQAPGEVLVNVYSGERHDGE